MKSSRHRHGRVATVPEKAQTSKYETPSGLAGAIGLTSAAGRVPRWKPGSAYGAAPFLHAMRLCVTTADAAQFTCINLTARRKAVGLRADRMGGVGWARQAPTTRCA